MKKWRVEEWPVPVARPQWRSPICEAQDEARAHAVEHGPGRYAFFTQGPGRLGWDSAGMLYLPEEQVQASEEKR